MDNFEFYNPVKIIFGVNESVKIGEVAKPFGKKALVVSYLQHEYMQDLLDMIRSSLRQQNIEVFTIFNVTANPMLSQVKEGIKICRDNSVDFVVGVGGGSVMDASKVIALGSLYEGEPWEMFASRYKNAESVFLTKSLPTIMIPTLPATSSEMNCIAVVTNDDTTEKSHIFNTILYPKVSIIDPSITCSLPTYQTACGAVDAISHVMESYFNCSPDTPFQDRLQEATILSIMELIPRVLAEPHNVSLRASIQWASTLAWNGWIQAGVSARSPMHQIGHVLSARFNVTHGATLGIIMPAFFKNIYKERTARFKQFGQRVFGLDFTSMSDDEAALQTILRFEDFISKTGVQTRLSQVNIHEDSYEYIANDVVRFSCDKDGNLPSNPPVNKLGIIRVLELAK